MAVRASRLNGARSLLRMDLLQCRWLFLTFFGSLILLCFLRFPYETLPSKAPDGFYFHTGIFVWLELLPCVFLSFLTAVQYYETFRTPSREYLQTLRVPVARLLVLRPLLMALLIALLYIPLTSHAVSEIWKSAEANRHSLPPEVVIPHLSFSYVYLRCVPALLLSMSVTLFLECLTRSRSVTLILMFAWFALETSGFTINGWSLFRPALRDLFEHAHEPSGWILLSALILHLLALLFYYKDSRGKA